MGMGVGGQLQSVAVIRSLIVSQRIVCKMKSRQNNGHFGNKDGTTTALEQIGMTRCTFLGHVLYSSGSLVATGGTMPRGFSSACAFYKSFSPHGPIHPIFFKVFLAATATYVKLPNSNPVAASTNVRANFKQINLWANLWVQFLAGNLCEALEIRGYMPTQPPEKVLNPDFLILVIRPLRFLLLDAVATCCVCCRRWLRVRAVCVGRCVMVAHGCFISCPPQS